MFTVFLVVTIFASLWIFQTVKARTPRGLLATIAMLCAACTGMSALFVLFSMLAFC